MLLVTQLTPQKPLCFMSPTLMYLVDVISQIIKSSSHTGCHISVVAHIVSEAEIHLTQSLDTEGLQTPDTGIPSTTASSPDL